MITRDQIEKIITDSLTDPNIYIVEIHVGQANSISVSLDSDQNIGIDDCVAVSRMIEGQLDRETEDFELVVTSAGLDQPFKIRRQYLKNIGKEIETVTKDGLKKKGTLTAVNDSEIELTWEEKVKIEGKKKKEIVRQTKTILFDEIKTAKLVITF